MCSRPERDNVPREVREDTKGVLVVGRFRARLGKTLERGERHHCEPESRVEGYSVERLAGFLRSPELQELHSVSQSD